MGKQTGSAELQLQSAIAHANAGQHAAALAQCEQGLAVDPQHPALLQLLAVLCLKQGVLPRAAEAIAASLASRPDHLPSLVVAAEVASASGEGRKAVARLLRAATLAPRDAEICFALALALQDAGDLEAATAALERVLTLGPPRVEAEVNLGILWQERGHFETALRAYGRAYRLRPDSFGRIAQALSSASRGGLWLELDALRQALQETPA